MMDRYSPRVRLSARAHLADNGVKSRIIRLEKLDPVPARARPASCMKDAQLAQEAVATRRRSSGSHAVQKPRREGFVGMQLHPRGLVAMWAVCVLAQLGVTAGQYYLGDSATVPAGTKASAYANRLLYYNYTGLCRGLEARGTNATSMVCKNAPCVNDIYQANTNGGGSIQCTANDMQLQGAVIKSVPVPCRNLNMSTTFVAQFILAANSVAQRSDIGVYFSEASRATSAALIGNATCTIGTVPYSGNVSFTELDTIPDYCGDATSSAPYNPIYPTMQVTLPCNLYDNSTKLLSYSYCISWKQSGGNPDLCYNPLQTVAGTGAKCVCGTVNVPISISCLFEANPDASCNDNKTCTIDQCNPIDDINNGCTHTDTCNDNIACTVDKCTAAGCTYTPIDSLCDDGISCTVDKCSSTTGCSNTKNNTLCDDGLGCSVDTCDGSLATNTTSGCTYLFGTRCPSDNIICTVDTCVENATAPLKYSCIYPLNMTCGTSVAPRRARSAG
eukprot:jgi/Mesvir1/13528/Mv04882-RA.1